MSNLKTITSNLAWNNYKYKLIYKDSDSFDDLPYEKVRQCYGVCFYKNKMVIGGHKNHWSLIGGTIEKGEDFETTLKREIQEESNMNVLKFLPIGYQQAFAEDGSDIYQLRFVCEVKPFGEFEKDPAGNVTGIKLINPKDYKKYFDWGEIGDRIIERAIKLRKNLL